MNVPASVAAGTAVDVSGFTNLQIQVQGAGWSATMQPQGRLRGGAWEDIGTAITITEVGDLVAIAPNVEEFRISTTVYASGAPAIRLHADRVPH